MSLCRKEAPHPNFNIPLRACSGTKQGTHKARGETLGSQHLKKKNKELRKKLREVAGYEARNKKRECPQKRGGV